MKFFYSNCSIWNNFINATFKSHKKVIWRVIRMQPIHAIQTGVRIGAGRGFSRFLTYLRLPGSIFLQIPFRNLTWNLRRTLFTFGGIALAICVLVGVIRFVDGADTLLADEQTLIKGTSENRIDVLLNNFYKKDQWTVFRKSCQNFTPLMGSFLLLN